MRLRFSIASIFLIWCWSIDSTDLKAQNTVQVDSSGIQGKWVVLPLVFFTPETNWGFGAASLYSFRFRRNDQRSRPSQFQIGFAYTLRDQILAYLPFQLFLRNDRYKVYGELGYYRYVYEFSGVGNTGTLSDSELYEVDFPRIRLNALYQAYPNLFVGLRYWMDDFNITKVADEGLLAKGDISGSEGSLLSGGGLIVNYDNRDRIFYPGHGYFFESVLFYNGAELGSDFDFTKLYVDGSAFYTLKEEHILAVNLYAELTWGTAPFNQLSLLGGPKRMRGYFEGRFRDNHYLMGQSEYRFPIYGRFGGVAFAGLGAVAKDFSAFRTEHLRWMWGLGLRFVLDPKEHVNLRLDAGFGRSSSGYYLTVAEAF